MIPERVREAILADFDYITAANVYRGHKIRYRVCDMASLGSLAAKEGLNNRNMDSTFLQIYEPTSRLMYEKVINIVPYIAFGLQHVMNSDDSPMWLEKRLEITLICVLRRLLPQKN